MNPAQTQLMAEIVNILGITKEEVAEINANFQELMVTDDGTPNNGTTTDVIKACKVYDAESFIIGCMVSTSMMDLVQTSLAENLAERDRLEGNCMYR